MDGPVLHEDRETFREDPGDVPARVGRGDVERPEVPTAGLPRRGGEEGGLHVAGGCPRRRKGHDREVRADGVEPAMREIDDASEREDERETERDQQIIGADEEAVEDLLKDKDELHAFVSRLRTSP